MRGAGPFVGNFVCAHLGERFSLPGDNYDFQRIFLVPCAVAVVAITISGASRATR